MWLLADGSTVVHHMLITQVVVGIVIVPVYQVCIIAMLENPNTDDTGGFGGRRSSHYLLLISSVILVMEDRRALCCVKYLRGEICRQNLAAPADLLLFSCDVRVMLVARTVWLRTASPSKFLT